MDTPNTVPQAKAIAQSYSHWLPQKLQKPLTAEMADALANLVAAAGRVAAAERNLRAAIEIRYGLQAAALEHDDACKALAVVEAAYTAALAVREHAPK